MVGRRSAPPPGWVRFGTLRRIFPVSPQFGFDRGTPVDRYYIEKHLRLHARDIRGRVLEIGDDAYTKKFGGRQVNASDILDLSERNERATIIADLTSASQIPSEAYDCIILTQTLQFVDDVHMALETLHRVLKPGGVLLATLPGISKIARDKHNQWHDQWRLTAYSCQKVFQRPFSADALSVAAYGNVLSAVAFLEGLAAHELTEEELDFRDPDFEVIIAVRAVKSNHQH